MANTGFIINNTVRQFFSTGPVSGSAVATGSDVDLTVSPFSASLEDTDYYNRAYEPDLCEPGFETCVVPLLTSLTTGSRRGRFAINYVTQSSFNFPINITASVSNTPDFSVSESFYAATGSGPIPVSSSFVSGTIYFRAFMSCSGPDPSPNSDPLSFTYDLLPPPLEAGSVNVVFKNNYSSTMEVLLRSTRGNATYRISPGQSVTYDYSTSPDPGAWTATGRSEDLNITIKGGARSAYGNYVQRVTNGVEKETYTTGGGFNSPSNRNENSSTFAADKGLGFTIRQLVLPKNGTTTTTTFTLLTVPPPPPPIPPPPPPPPPPGPSGPPPVYVPQPTIKFGSAIFDSEEAACTNFNENYRAQTYYQFGNVLYLNRTDALSSTRGTFPNTENYILYGDGTYYVVNKDGRLQNTGACRRPSITLSTFRGAYATQEEACARQKVNGGNTTYEIGKIRVSGRFPIYEGVNERGGKNAIVSGGRVVAYETCGTELTDVTYSSTGFASSYDLNNPSTISPRLLNYICNFSGTETYSIGPSGTVYYGFNYKGGKYKYVPLTFNRWYKTTDGSFVSFDRGQVTGTANPC